MTPPPAAFKRALGSTTMRKGLFGHPVAALRPGSGGLRPTSSAPSLRPTSSPPGPRRTIAQAATQAAAQASARAASARAASRASTRPRDARALRTTSANALCAPVRAHPSELDSNGMPCLLAGDSPWLPPHIVWLQQQQKQRQQRQRQQQQQQRIGAGPRSAAHHSPPRSPARSPPPSRPRSPSPHAATDHNMEPWRASQRPNVAVHDDHDAAATPSTLRKTRVRCTAADLDAASTDPASPPRLDAARAGEGATAGLGGNIGIGEGGHINGLQLDSTASLLWQNLHVRRRYLDIIETGGTGKGASSLRGLYEALAVGSAMCYGRPLSAPTPPPSTSTGIHCHLPHTPESSSPSSRRSIRSGGASTGGPSLSTVDLTLAGPPSLSSPFRGLTPSRRIPQLPQTEGQPSGAMAPAAIDLAPAPSVATGICTRPASECGLTRWPTDGDASPA